MENKKLVIGLFGFGVVGEGLYSVLAQTKNLQATIKKICIKDATKKRNAPALLFTTNLNELLDDPEINVIVEAISDSEVGLTIITKALHNNKQVVSASKKTIAENLATLLSLQAKYNNSLLYEAAVCASIPIIRTLEEYYDNDFLQAFSAIVNGSTNYILTKIIEENLSFKEALLKAQQLGFAEADPTLDVNGIDAVNKMSILLLHAFGIEVHPTQLLHTGIQHLQKTEQLVAKEKGYTIKLVAEAKKLQSGKVAAFVLPQFIPKQHYLYHCNNEFNSIVVQSTFAEQQLFYGKGAGAYPTASALLSDVSALQYNYKYGYKKRHIEIKNELETNFYLRVLLSFNKLDDIPLHQLYNLEEWHFNDERKYIIASISANTLLQNDWWQKNKVSLIVMLNGIIEHTELKEIKIKSLALAAI